MIWPPPDCNQHPVHSAFESSNMSWRLVILLALIYQQGSLFWEDIDPSSFLLCECCEILTWGRLSLILYVHLLGFELHPKVPSRFHSATTMLQYQWPLNFLGTLGELDHVQSLFIVRIGFLSFVTCSDK